MPKLNLQEVDWPKFCNTLKLNLANLTHPTAITNKNTFTRKLAELNKAVWDSINKHIKESKPVPYSKRWWSSALTQEKRQTARLRQKFKRYRDYPDHPVHEEYRQQRNKYAQHIKKAKDNH